MKLLWKGEPPVTTVPGVGPVKRGEPFEVSDELGKRLSNTEFFDKAGRASVKAASKPEVEPEKTEGGNDK